MWRKFWDTHYSENNRNVAEVPLVNSWGDNSINECGNKRKMNERMYERLDEWLAERIDVSKVPSIGLSVELDFFLVFLLFSLLRCCISWNNLMKSRARVNFCSLYFPFCSMFSHTVGIDGTRPTFPIILHGRNAINDFIENVDNGKKTSK